MTGFGSGPFGGGPGGFGEHNWSRSALYLVAPEPYRIEDDNADQLFLKYTQAQGEVFDDLRRKIRSFGDLRDPLRVRTRYNEVQTLRLGRRIEPKLEVEQSGIEGSVSASTQFSAIRARFKESDAGKLLTVENSKVLGNNRTVKVASIISTNIVATDPPLAPDSGPLRWSLRAENSTADFSFEVDSGDVEPINPDWILTDGSVSIPIASRRQFFTDDTHTQQTDAEGVDGSISSGVFTSATANFSQSDVGKRFTISGSAIAENNVKTEVSEVLSSTTITLTATLADDSSALTWALLKRPILTLSNDAALTGFVEQGSFSAEVTAPSTIVALNGQFTASDVGKLITIRADSDANNGTYTIASYVSGTEITVDATLVTSGPYLWEVRSPTRLSDTSTVEVYAPSLIEYLAQDFGITIDNRESEEFQRRWVASVPRWMSRKGTEQTYQYLAKLTGFDITATKLFRISQIILDDNPLLDVLLVGESEAGRFGFADGVLTLVGLLVRFSSTSAVFTAGDIGRQIEVTSSGSGNDGLRTIETVISATEVEFRSVDSMNGASETGLDWRIIRIYGQEPPGIPVMDEINVDLMVYLKTPIPLAGRSGSDGFLTGTNTFTSATGGFSQTDLPLFIQISGSGSGNDGQYAIETIVSATEITVDAASLTTPDVNNGTLNWQIVELPFTIDKYCFEANWSTLIGSGDGYLEAISVSPASPSPFPITYTISVIGDANVVTGAGVGSWLFTDNGGTAFFLEDGIPTELVESSGATGSLLVGTPYVFNAAGAFTAADVNKKIRVTGSVSGNDGLYTIAAFVDASNVELRSDDTPNAPDGNNGSLGWSIVTFAVTTTATVPPTIGAATLEYICPNSGDCGYCGSNKVLIEGTTNLLLEQPFERLFDRLEEGRPKHVEFVSRVGQTASGTVVITGGGSTA